jgi:hypothetical protein
VIAFPQTFTITSPSGLKLSLSLLLAVARGEQWLPVPKKRSFPTKPCPRRNQPIHAAKQSHEACGWTMNGKATAVKRGRPKASGEVTVEDIQAVKKLVDAMGSQKVQELARVLRQH